MSVLDVFNVISTNSNEADRRPMRTEVHHQSDGEHDIVRIEQAAYNEDDDADVVILTRKDFERLASILKGH